MSKITCKLFGVPKITKDGQSVFLPYAKINALLYYMLVSKVVSRDEVVGLLWPDEDEKIAKKNLRNAIYQAKKSLGEDIIISPKKSFLILNEELDIESDIDQFVNAPRENMDLYTGDFLQGFFLKDAESYEYWIVKMRNYYKEKFASECYQKIEEDIQNRNYDDVERHIQRLTELDEYDERNFRLLMRFYQDTGRNSKVIETYYDLSKLLRRDLGIDPDQKTKEIYERSLEQINFGGAKYSHDDSFFYGRYSEVATLEKAFKAFKDQKDSKSLLITGERGVGKSTVKRRLLEEVPGDFFVLESRCLQIERDLPLRPWRAIVREIARLTQRNRLIPPDLWRDLMTQIFPDFSENQPSSQFLTAQSDLSFGSIIHIIVEALVKLASKKQVLLVFEDLQWMDPDSLRLLTAVLLEIPPDQVMLVATRDQEHNQVMEDAITTLSRCSRLVTIPLERFSIEACHHFIEEALPDGELKGETLEHIYNQTEGNPFFLREYIELLKAGADANQMSPAMWEALKERFLYLPPEAVELAGIISYFYDAVPFRLLLQIADRPPDQVLRFLEMLKDRNILSERESEQDTVIRFTHTKLREYLYMSEPPSRKKLFHQKIGLLLEQNLANRQTDNKLYSKLIYHFSAAGDYLKALKYQIDTLNHYLNFSHEMFPVLNNLEMEQEANPYMSRSQIGELFFNLETSFKQVRDSEADSRELDLLEVEFFYMKGRYLIREGSYEDGVNNIMCVIEKSKHLGIRDYTLEGYKQMILYYLQINDPSDMAQYVDLALDLAVKCNYHKEIGIILRLKGLCNMMAGNYCLAEKLLNESINTLAVTENVAKLYATNIAAAYSYIGEIRQAEEDYPGALQLFDKAISLCLGKNALASLSYFYINAGKTAYYMENIQGAREYFERAYSLYGQFDSFWRRSVLDSYMALTLIREGDYPQALKYLTTARDNAGYIKDPNDLGTVFFAEALIRRMSDLDESVGAVFGPGLPEEAEDYCRQALSNLNEYCNRYEIKYLNQTFSPDPTQL